MMCKMTTLTIKPSEAESTVAGDLRGATAGEREKGNVGR